MDCPRCGAPADAGPECPRCGVVLAKARPPRRGLLRARDEPAPLRSVVVPVLGLVAVVVAGIAYVRQQPPTAAPARSPAEGRTAQPQQVPPPSAADEQAPPVEVVGPVPDARALAAETDAQERAAIMRLQFKLRGRAMLDADDLRLAERLYSEKPDAARELLEAVLLATAGQERLYGRHSAAAELVDRAIVLAPNDPVPRRARLAIANVQADWTVIETCARELLALVRNDGEAVRSLAYALIRQDRSREAAELLTAYLDGRQDPQASALLGRIRHETDTDTGLSQQSLAHFHVRYDGEAHEDVGREVLRVCERHYATLARTFDHEPSQPIGIVLLSRRRYASTGAPAWSGGVYDTFDGRVRIPIGGLTTSLSPYLDGTVLHELTHAFVADKSGGQATTLLQEGLAQMMEGHRTAEIGDSGLSALADGRIREPAAMYLRALALTEELVAQRGLGGINEALAVMKTKSSEDAGFRAVFGRDLHGSDGLEAAWWSRLRQRYGRSN